MKAIISIISSLLILQSFMSKEISANPCEGSWELYKDEKCIKIFDISELHNYEEAEKFCKEKHEADLVSIRSEDKQKFLENYLKFYNIVDYIWIGLKFASGNSYLWADGADFKFTNWATNSPKNDPSYCVQIETDEAEFGRWSEMLCDQKRPITLCEKPQSWSTSQLQNEFINLKYEINNLKANPIPIGFIYVQLPNEKAPQEVWPNVMWEDVSEKYAGVFFRVEGGNAAGFGEIQEENSPRLVHVHRVETSNAPYDIDILANGQPSASIDADDSEHDDRALEFTVSGGEVRPRNMAIRIWKRSE